MPTPEEKAAAAPLRETLAAALTEIDSQEKADAIVESLAAEVGKTKAADVARKQPPPQTPAEAAQEVQQAAEAAPDGEKVKAALTETARVVTTPDKRTREVVAEAAQEIFDPEQQGAPTVADPRQREYLRRALIKRLKPLDAVDAELFLAVNHLPHTRLLNRIFYTITLVFTGGTAWYVLMAGLTLVRPRFGWRVARDSVVPLAIATSLVEHPIKRYFRRRRPFITIVQAVAIGLKPGSWSFPSGHAAGAFAGAWLLSRHLPRQRGLLYTLASLVAFSRVYLGDHYPGDVVSGSALGALFAWLLRRLFDWVLGRKPR
jgi:undecaprenyl-diphosphatase